MLSEQANKIIANSYLMEGEKNWDELCNRVATVIASGDSDNQKQFHRIMAELKFIPGGRVLRNAGRKRGSLLNCYALPIGDSIEEIGECNKEALILWSEGGGVGIPFSTLRPIGSPINGKGGESSGLVSFMSALDGLAATIESGGGRRAASLGSCDISHPEIERFIDAKLKDGIIKYFNISVNVTHEFLKAVIADEEFELKFHGLPYKKIKAAKLWNKIIDNTYKNGEPGILMWDNLIKNNSYYFAPIISTNPSDYFMRLIIVM